MKWVDEISLKGKRAILRADFNVPLTENGEVADDFRITAALPTIRRILSSGASLTILSHLGDPEGKLEEKLSLKKVQGRLAELLGADLAFASDLPQALSLSKELKPRKVLLAENVRFHKGEQENQEEFAKTLSELGDVFVLDAFGVVHREHASLTGIPKFLPSAGGLLLKKEIEGLKKLLENPERPVAAVIGGAKAESKLAVIDRISEIADAVLLGNLLANEMKAKGMRPAHPDKIRVPLDGIPGNGEEYDIGPKTRELYEEKLQGAKTIFWAGPLGKYEDERYVAGSLAVADSILENRSYGVAGGGNLLDMLGRYGLREKFDHISTGGSSMLAFLAGKELPGLKALGYYD